MSLSINVRHDDHTVVVTLSGAADASMLIPLRDPITPALGDAPLVVLDLDALTTTDPAALRALVVAVLDDARGGRLRIAASQVAAVDALTAARVHHLVAVHPTVAAARAAHNDERAR